MIAARVHAGARPGTILIVTMVLVFALAGVTLALCRSMRVEIIASGNYAAALQASTIERGAEQYLTAILAEEGDDLNSLTEDYFAAVPVGDGYFWVLRPDYGDSSLPLFGLVDESAKLNINTATYDQLMVFPCMTDDVAAAIVDWHDEDSDTSPGGAEDEYYLSLPDGYYTKNAPFETVEELSLVRGVVPELLYGTGDAPPLGTASLFSTIGSSGGSSMLEDVWLQRGISDLLTVWGGSSAASPGGQQVNLSARDSRDQLRDLLRDKLGSQRGDQIANAVGDDPLIDVFDLYFRGRMTATELSEIEDSVTSGDGAGAGGAGPGRINVNFAPREVLLTIESLDASDIDKLISARRGLDASELNSIAWVADVLGQKAVGLGNRITGRSNSYSALILAVSGNGRAFKLVRVVFDAGGQTPQIVYRRDLTERGWPMDPEILATIRSGQVPAVASGRTSKLGTSLGGLLR